MAFLGPTELKTFLASAPIVANEDGSNAYDQNRVEQAAYALSLGSEAYRTDNIDRKIEILDDNNRTIEINPGQFTLLMTKEVVAIPKDKLAFISIKAKQKLKGLINISGFHVDPGYEGKLLFSVYNASPSTITLQTKRPYFLIWFAALETEASQKDAYNPKNNSHQGQQNIPPEYLDALKRGEMVSPHALMEKIKDTKAELEKKVDDRNRKLSNIDYFIKFCVGILAAIFLRVLFVEIGTAYYVEKLEKKDSLVVKLNARIDTLKNNSLTLSQLDSLLQQRSKNKNEGTP